MRNVHERHLSASPGEVAELIGSLASPADRLWPRGLWPAMRLDGPLAPGARGGHGPIRYTVEAHEPGRRTVFRFEPPTPYRGVHLIEVEPAGDGSLLRHAIEARANGRGLLLWPLAFRWLHDALVEDLLDNAERALGSEPAPRRHGPWVRALRRAVGARGRRRRSQRGRSVSAA